MPPRYTVRRLQGDILYSVWDSETDKIAISEGRDCADLGFDEAFKIADRLNAERAAEREVGRLTSKYR